MRRAPPRGQASYRAPPRPGRMPDRRLPRTSATACRTSFPRSAELLGPDRPIHLEVHHLLGHDHALLDLAHLLDIPVETWVHDYAALCPRIALVGRDRRYCGEPDLAAVRGLRRRSRGLLGEPITVLRAAGPLRRPTSPQAGAWSCPSRDTAQRLRRHFPLVRPRSCPGRDNSDLPPMSAAVPAAITRICVVGAIGVEKGYDVLLGCVRDARPARTAARIRRVRLHRGRRAAARVRAGLHHRALRGGRGCALDPGAARPSRADPVRLAGDMVLRAQPGLAGGAERRRLRSRRAGRAYPGDRPRPVCCRSGCRFRRSTTRCSALRLRSAGCQSATIASKRRPDPETTYVSK